jgi:hypothetical protein
VTIKQLLQTDLDVHISTVDRWLVGDGCGGYIVYESVDNKPQVIIQTENEHEAVEFLIKNKNIENFL